MPPRSLGELARLAGGDLEGGASLEIRGFASLESAGPGGLSFVAADRDLDGARRGAAAGPSAPPGFDPRRPPLVRAARPHSALAPVLPLFFPPPVVTPGVHPTAYIADSARIAPTATVGAFTVVGERSMIGDGAVLYTHVFVGPDCRVGEGNILHP